MKLKKTMTLTTLFALVITIGLPAIMFARNESNQEEKGIPGNVYINLGFQSAFPQGEFKKNNDNNGYGVNFEGSYGFEKFPLALGLSGAYMVYGSETRKEPWSTTVPDVMLNVERTYSLSFGNVFLRLQNQSGTLRPYVDVFGGFHYLSTDTKVNNEHNSSQEYEIASTTNFDDFTYSYGAHAGLMIKLTNIKDDNNQKAGLLLDLNAGYMLGGEAEYLPKGGLEVRSGKLYYNIKKSKTDMLALRLGLVINL